MPVVTVRINTRLRKGKRLRLLSEVTDVVSSILEKPSRTVMASCHHADIILGLSTGPAAFFDIQSIGAISKETSSVICHRLHDILSGYLKVDPKRIYINFTDVRPRDAWKFVDGCAVCP